MRLHRLEIQAFGPFATSAAVDFDTLSDAGLFLLSGATGAGKTSVLDAVCFALYGDVPGDRSTAKRLRADQADPGATPRVTLEATLSARRFRIVRSPAWERPKRRGTGTTPQPSTVTISERVAGQWVPLSSRLDETGDLVTRLLGMNLTQFTQVAMLPQGRFQAFLRARSDDRHRLLQQLFRTGRFEDVERWLRERRLELGRGDAAEHQRVADLVSRASEAADVALPAAWDLHDVAPAADDGTLRRWVDGLLGDASTTRTAATERADTAAEAEVRTRGRLETGRAQAARLQRLHEARRERAELETRADAHADDVRRLDAGRRAAAVLPLRRLAESARAACETSEAFAETAAERAWSHTDGQGAELATVAARAAEAVAEARALQPRVARLGQASERLAGLRRHRERLTTDLAQVGDERAAAPARVEALRVEVAAATASAARVDELTSAAQEARVRLDAHGQVEQLRPRLLAAREEWVAARAEALVLKEALLTLQQARIEGMAAELAGSLVVGGCCPVCGSADHPDRARPAPGAPDAVADKQARTALDDASAVEHARDAAVRDLEQNLATAAARAGETPSDRLAADLTRLQEALGAAHQASGRLTELEAQLAEVEGQLHDLDARASTLVAEAAATDADHAALAHETAGLQTEVDGLLGGWPDLGALIRHHETTVELCRDAERRRTEAAAAATARAEAERALASATRTEGFTDAAEARAAVLDPTALGRLADAVTRHQRRLAAVTEVLDGHDGDDEAALPDVKALESDHAQALAVLGQARADVRLFGARTERLAGLLAELDAVLAAWAPLRHDLAVVTRLSAFVEGKSADNLLRMRLSAYVLAYRLGQVVAAANERLARMSDQRYSLEHTGQRGAGETRGGLSLLVRDDWSGESRDPATLSGGETFVVSLALALGLADVIAHEAGGAALDTLFVDEGFGSLDADTLDDVLDTLDSLRDGGRVVGVVSHVAEMRDRIPTQLHVTKARRGSSLAVRR